MNKLEFETERLRLQSLTTDDSNFIIELLNSEGWLKNIGDRNVRTPEQVETYLRNGPHKSYELHGFGLSRVSLKSNGQPIGMCGLLQRDYLAHPDIGYALLPQHTGQGYILEVAQKVVEFGFSHLGLTKIQATTVPANAASIRVLERLGFVFEKKIFPQDVKEELLLWGLEKPS